MFCGRQIRCLPVHFTLALYITLSHNVCKVLFWGISNKVMKTVFFDPKKDKVQKMQIPELKINSHSNTNFVQ